MKYIDIFLASSITDLHNERMELGNYIRTLNNKFIDRGVYFRLHMCEDISDEIALTRKQDEYNEVIRECEYFYVLFKNKTGAYTIEEFDVALEKFKATGAPKIRTYFIKSECETSRDVSEFMRRLESELQHYYSVIDSIDTIKLKMLLELAAGNDLQAEIEFKDAQVLLDGEIVKSIDLDSLPLYANHDNISKLRVENTQLEQEFVNARLDMARNPADDGILNKLLKVSERKNKVQEELHKIEKELMKAASRIIAISNSGEYITARAQKAIELFEQGKFDEAMAILDDEERKRDTEYALQRLEDDKNELRGLLKEISLKIDTVKAKGINEEIANEIIKLYEEAESLIVKGGLEYDLMDDYVLFLTSQKRFAKAIETGERVYHTLIALNDTQSEMFINICAYLASAYGEVRSIDKAVELYKQTLTRFEELPRRIRDKKRNIEAGLYNDLAKLYLEKVDLIAANKLLHRAYSIYRELSKSNPGYNQALAMVCNNLGELNRQKKDYKLAEKLFKTAAALCARLYKENPGRHAGLFYVSTNNLGLTMKEQGNYKEAERHLNNALELARSLVKHNPYVYSLDVIRACNNLAVVHMEQQHFDVAEKYYKEALDTSLKLAEADHDVYDQYVALGYSNMALLHNSTTGSAGAVPLQEKALEIYRRLAQKNPDVYKFYVATVCGNLSLCYGDNMLEKAEERGKEAIGILRELALTKPSVYEQNLCLACTSLGSLYNRIDRYDEAEACLREAVEISKRLIARGVGTEAAAAAYYNLGDTLYYSDRDDEAEKMYIEAIHIYSILAEESPEVYFAIIMSVYADLCALYDFNGRYDEAEDTYRDALDMCRPDRKLSAMEVSLIAGVHASLAEMLERLDRKDEALETYMHGVEMYRKLDVEGIAIYGETYGESCLDAADMYAAKGELDDAEKLYVEAENAFKAFTQGGNGDCNPQMCRALYNVGCVYRQKDDEQRMSEAWSKALVIAEKYKDSDDYCAKIYELLIK